MLYVSTRNPADTYTAYRAIHEDVTPDGGQYVPFHLPVFNREELAALRGQSFCATVAQVLNLLFSLNLSGWDIGSVVGKMPVKLEAVGQRLEFAELWHNPEGNCQHIFNRLYKLISQSDHAPIGWTVVAIKIALLFAICSGAEKPLNNFDVAVNADDFSEITAVCYCKKMGLPINLLICACNEGSSVWDLVNKGEYSTGTHAPKFMESFLYAYFDAEQVRIYLNALQNKATYYIDELRQQLLSDGLFAAVVSDGRADTVISSMHSSNQYALDNNAALAYGALQDYRASIGVSNDTLILSKQRPVKAKE